jgi:hypothetical protein
LSCLRGPLLRHCSLAEELRGPRLGPDYGHLRSCRLQCHHYRHRSCEVLQEAVAKVEVQAQVYEIKQSLRIQ